MTLVMYFYPSTVNAQVMSAEITSTTSVIPIFTGATSNVEFPNHFANNMKTCYFIALRPPAKNITLINVRSPSTYRGLQIIWNIFMTTSR